MGSTSEKTFGQRLEKGRQALDIVTGWPDYTPTNDLITLANLKTFFNDVEAKNDDVTQKGDELSDARASRRDLYFGAGGLKERAPRARDHVGSLAGGKNSAAYKRLQKLVQKLNSQRPATKPLTGETPTGATSAGQKRISQSERSYGSMAQMGRDLATHVAGTSGYAPTNAKITAAGLDAFAVDLEADNRVVTQKLTIADDAIKTRGDMYENEDTGLLARIKLMKSYVSGEIGKKSEVYQQLVALHI